MGAPLAVGIAVLIVYFIHYVSQTLAVFGKGNVDINDVQERGRKLYLFGTIALLSIHFVSTFGAIMAWITVFVIIGYYGTMGIGDEEKKKRLFALLGLAYTVVVTAWWIGDTAKIFMIKPEDREYA